MNKTTVLFLFFIMNIYSVFSQVKKSNNSVDQHLDSIIGFYDLAKTEYDESKDVEAVFHIDRIFGYLRRIQIPYYDTVFIQKKDSVLKISLSLMNKIVDRNQNAHFYSVRGTLNGDLKNYSAAIDDLSHAIESDSLNSIYYYNRAIFYDRLNNVEASLADYTKSINLNRRFGSAYQNRGFIMLDMGFYELAKNDFLMALKLNEDQIGSSYNYNNIGFAYYKLKDNKKAMKNIEKSIKMNSENPYAFKNKALVEIAENKMDAACESLERANSLGFANKYGSEVDELILQYCGQK